MKYNLTIFVLVLVLLTNLAYADASDHVYTVSINGVTTGGTYYIEDEVVMVPLRHISEALGYEVLWFSEDRHIELVKGPRWVYIKTVENHFAFGKMAPLALEKQAIIINGTTYVPMSFVTDFLGAYSMVSDGTLIIESDLQENVNTGGFIITSVTDERIVASYLGGDAHITITEETTFSRYGEDGLINFSDLKVGDHLKLTHPPFMIAIYPPQYAPSHIEILGDVMFKEGVITAVGDNWILIGSFEQGIRINIGEMTRLENAFGKTIELDTLRVGNRVKAYHSMMATFSIPPQSPGFLIIQN